MTREAGRLKVSDSYYDGFVKRADERRSKRRILREFHSCVFGGEYHTAPDSNTTESGPAG
jgi:hypothetical protein